MTYDEGLAERIRALLDEETGFSEKAMFGGVAFFLDGNMACGVTGPDLMVRVGKDRYQACLQEPYAKPFDMTGRPMKGWVSVASQAIGEDGELQRWLQMGLETARALPPK